MRDKLCGRLLEKRSQVMCPHESLVENLLILILVWKIWDHLTWIWSRTWWWEFRPLRWYYESSDPQDWSRRVLVRCLEHSQLISDIYYAVNRSVYLCWPLREDIGLWFEDSEKFTAAYCTVCCSKLHEPQLGSTESGYCSWSEHAGMHSTSQYDRNEWETMKEHVW